MRNVLGTIANTQLKPAIKYVRITRPVCQVVSNPAMGGKPCRFWVAIKILHLFKRRLPY